MTLQELRYLVALADKGHFVRAAESCNVGQPTLSTQLKKLDLTPVANTPAEFAKELAQERETWKGVIARLGLTLE